ncbi:hypothetical protein GQF01_22180 [Paenibacillus sp. 5J-6]|uniref:CBM-cenC domain-containing protein n=1 Tax=Paenibacillus silvestris TaxID=2606219 RepID=A0A6L8V5D0_9BACL|nr:hypothetical protein [Paenibacillus silvestris]MZQ84822.1 hypothetical protein [Paenibacillus silvestris]
MLKKQKARRVINRKSIPRITQVRNPGFEDSSFSPWRAVGDVFLSRSRPNVGRQHAKFEVPSNRSASLTQLVHLGSPGRNNSYQLSFSVNSPSLSGNLQISFLGTLRSSAVIPLRVIPNSRYQRFAITLPASALQGRDFFELEFRVNAAGQTATLNLDTVVIVPS